MSADKFSAALTKNLLQKLGRTLQTNIDSITKVKETALNKVNESSSDLARSTGGIRLLTDNNQEGIVTKNGLQLLANRFTDAISNPKLLKTISRSIDPEWKNISIDFLVKKYVWIQAEKGALVKYLINESKEKLKLPRGKKLTDEMPGGNAFQKTGTYLDSFNTIFNNIIGNLSAETSSVLSNPYTYNNFVQFLSTKNLKDFNPNLAGNSGASFKGIHRDINKYFKEYLISSGTPKYLAEFIDINCDAGHLLGMFSEQLAFATGGQIYVSAKGPDDLVPKVELEVFPLSAGPITPEQQNINKIFSELMELTANADLISSGFIKDIQLFADSTKNIASANNQANFQKFLASVEMQLGKDNSLGGSILNQISKRMKSLIGNAEQYLQQGGNREVLDKLEREAAADLAAIFKSTKSIADYVSSLAQEMSKKDIYGPAQKLIIEYLEKNSRELATTLIETSGSDPIKLSIKKYLISGLDPTQKYSPSNPVTKAKSKSSVAGTKSRNKLTVSKPKIKPVSTTKKTNKFVVNKTKLNVPKVIRRSPIGLPSLLNRINGLIQQQVRNNMGTGSSKAVLNYRTGRFSESVKVERLSESRQGMITAFYSYMKNPYATFSQGGRQQYPRSRDPKTLISKSIREIAQTMVTNQLRAVNV